MASPIGIMVSIKGLAGLVLAGALGLSGLAAGMPAPAHAAGWSGVDDPAIARSHPLPLSDNSSGLTISTLGDNGYTLTLGQYGTRGQLVTAAVQRTLPANDTVLEFSFTLPGRKTRYSGLIHAFRHDDTLVVAAWQREFVNHGNDYASTVHPHTVPMLLDGTISGVRHGPDGSLVGTYGHIVIEVGRGSSHRTYVVYGSIRTRYGPLS